MEPGEASNDAHNDDYPEGEDFDVEIEIDCDDVFGRNGPFGRKGPFGPEGPFGPKGPFGPQGPFGAGGFMGASGLFGQRGKRHKMHRGGGHRRGRRMFGPGELRLVLLALVAEEARHGYDCIKALEEATHGAYAPSPGVIYPTLQMLLDEGLITERASEDSRKVYEVTDEGRAELADRKDEIDELLERLGRKAERASAARSSEVMRSLGNLASVLTNAASRGKLSSENRGQIVDMIDELARKIERL
ncbi:MAG: helix-turn-helix transcriptional regulator [Erythrobacter sp.]|nr:helix-turn-helix transcriptional regulator [Erythrobacter sp.]